MTFSPFFSILKCLDLTPDKRNRLFAQTEVPSRAVALFFRISSECSPLDEVSDLLDELADFGECVFSSPDPIAWERIKEKPRDFFWLLIVPIEALGSLKTLFDRPTIERFSYTTWEDRETIRRFLEETSAEDSGQPAWQPGDPLDQARSFILSSAGSRLRRVQTEPLPTSSTQEHKRVVTLPDGFRSAGVRCGIKSAGMDLGILVSDRPAEVAGRFTKNRFCSPPVQLTRNRVALGDVRAVVVNSGNANAATGDRGMQDAVRMADLAAEHLGLDPKQVVVCSTGVIGQFLPMDKIETGIRDAVSRLCVGQDDLLIQAIMTTDTVYKSATRQFDIGNRTISLGGIAKGSGMIHPNMATMHVYLTTDAAVAREALDLALGEVVRRSFNCLTVDGDTSTSDSVLLFANGAADNPPIERDSEEFRVFKDNLSDLCVDLTRQLARDGEGATHLIRVVCEGAVDWEDAHKVAESVATSLLVKTAIFGRDPNWGRIIMAIGKTDARFDPDRVRVWMDGILLFENGLAVDYDSDEMDQRLSQEEIEIRIDLGQGEAEPVTVYTCDLSYDYVRINAEYHT